MIIAQSLQAPHAKSVSCFARHGFVLLGRDPAWRLEPAAPAEAQAQAVAALLPAWVPLAPMEEDSEDAENDAAGTAADDDAATGELQGAQVEGRPAEDGEHAAPATDEQSGHGDGQAGTADGGQTSDAVTFEESAGPAEPEPAVAVDVPRGCHVVLAAPLWPRLCKLDPELPAELLRAKGTIHLVADSRVSPYRASIACPLEPISGTADLT